MTVSEFSKEYRRDQGIDLQAYMVSGKHPVEKVCYTVTREMAPVYTMGKDNPRSFAGPKRGIAGSLIVRAGDVFDLVKASEESESFDLQLDAENTTHDKKVRMAIRGAELLNAGTKLTTENIKKGDVKIESGFATLTFIALEIIPWHPAGGNYTDIDSVHAPNIEEPKKNPMEDALRTLADGMVGFMDKMVEDENVIERRVTEIWGDKKEDKILETLKVLGEKGPLTPKQYDVLQIMATVHFSELIKSGLMKELDSLFKK